MIKSFLFEGFKGYDKAVLWLEQLTTLIGSNASGKSNAIEGIQILSELATGRELSVIFDESKHGEGWIRGGARGCCRFSTGSFQLGCSVDWDEKYDLLYRVQIGVSNHITIKNESLYLVKNAQTDAKNGELIFKASSSDEKEGTGVAEYTGGKGTPCQVQMRMSVLSQMQSRIASNAEQYDSTIEKIKRVQNDLMQIYILDPIPAKMRIYSHLGDSILRRNCSNISSVLYDMKEKNPDHWRQFCEIVRNLPENEISDIQFVKTQINDVILVQKEKNGKKAENIDATRLSDGTLRCIAFLASVMCEPENSLIVVEEMDNGIHPSRLTRLVFSLGEIAQKRNIDFMITTHNATLLNGFNKKGILGVSVVYRDAEKQASRIIPFVEIYNQAGLLASGGIGDAMLSEQLLSSIKKNYTPEPFDF